MDMYDVLEKYNLKEKADEQYDRETANHFGATDDRIRYNIYVKFIEAKWREIRDEKLKLEKQQPCDFNLKIREFDEAMDELRKAMQDFKNAAIDFYWNQ